jgi:hypothetical protein
MDAPNKLRAAAMRIATMSDVMAQFFTESCS